MSTMTTLVTEALAKYEETVIEIEKTKERHFSKAHRKWPSIEPMEARRDALKESIITLVASLEAQANAKPLPPAPLHSTDPLPSGETNYLAND